VRSKPPRNCDNPHTPTGVANPVARCVPRPARLLPLRQSTGGANGFPHPPPVCPPPNLFRSLPSPRISPDALPHLAAPFSLLLPRVAGGRTSGSGSTPLLPQAVRRACVTPKPGISWPDPVLRHRESGWRLPSQSPSLVSGTAQPASACRGITACPPSTSRPPGRDRPVERRGDLPGCRATHRGSPPLNGPPRAGRWSPGKPPRPLPGSVLRGGLRDWDGSAAASGCC